jgi:hypothetical protein
MTIAKVLITNSNLFYTLLIFNWSLLNNKFVTPAGYVNNFNGVIVD